MPGYLTMIAYLVVLLIVIGPPFVVPASHDHDGSLQTGSGARGRDRSRSIRAGPIVSAATIPGESTVTTTGGAPAS